MMTHHRYDLDRYRICVETHRALPEWRWSPPYDGAWVIVDTDTQRIVEPADEHIFPVLEIKEAWDKCMKMNALDRCVD